LTTINNINDLIIKQRDCDPKLHRWKTWKPNTPFAPNVDVSLYIDNLGNDVAEKLIDLIEDHKVGPYKNRAWEKYNLFEWSDNTIESLKNKIWEMYLNYCASIDVEPYSRDYIWIRGWAVKLEAGDDVGMHSHSLHENTFISGNISLTQNNTTTDYWIPLFSLYHGTFQCENHPGKIVMFPSWVQHGVNPNESGIIRYSLAFDLFTKKSMDYVIETKTENTDLGKVILSSVPL
jgi:Putative 2OG-Fe(II) oxygenase